MGAWLWEQLSSSINDFWRNKKWQKKKLDVDAAEIVLTADIKEDLEADSLDVFEIMNELEDELDIQLEADESIKTIKDVVDHVAKQLEAND